jgi:quinol monooxygenase YgiN
MKRIGLLAVVLTVSLVAAAAIRSSMHDRVKPADSIDDLIARIEKAGSGDKPFTLLVQFKVKEGKAGKLEKLMKAAEESTHKEPGNVFYSFHRGLEHPEQYVVYESFASTQALRDHVAYKPVQELLAAFGEDLAEPPSISLYSPVVAPKLKTAGEK